MDFVQTYCIGSMIDDSPSAKYIAALREMENALTQSRPYNIELPRGSGKTSAAEMAVLWLISSGLRKFAVIVSANHAQAQNIIKDIFRPIVEQGTAFSTDFPEVCIPF